MLLKSRRIDIEGMWRRLDKAIADAGGVRAYARRVGVSPAYISQVRSRDPTLWRPPGPSICADLGIKPVRMWDVGQE